MRRIESRFTAIGRTLIYKGFFKFLLFLPIVASANTTLTCTPPTLNVDGTAITGPLTFNFYASQVSGGPYSLLTTEGVCEATVVLDPGDWYFVATSVNELGEESAYSNEVTKTVPNPVPSPPTNLTVVGQTVFSYSISENKLAMIEVGTVPVGTPCDTTQSMNGLYLVPRESVNWLGSVQPPINFANCG